MNAKKSRVLFAIAAVVLAGVVYGFAKGAGQTEIGLKIAWMGGSLIVAALGVLASYKLRK